MTLIYRIMQLINRLMLLVSCRIRIIQKNTKHIGKIRTAKNCWLGKRIRAYSGTLTSHDLELHGIPDLQIDWFRGLRVPGSVGPASGQAPDLAPSAMDALASQWPGYGH